MTEMPQTLSVVMSSGTGVGVGSAVGASRSVGVAPSLTSPVSSTSGSGRSELGSPPQAASVSTSANASSMQRYFFIPFTSPFNLVETARLYLLQDLRRELVKRHCALVSAGAGAHGDGAASASLSPSTSI